MSELDSAVGAVYDRGLLLQARAQQIKRAVIEPVNELVGIGDIPLREEGWTTSRQMVRSHFIWSGRGGRSQRKFRNAFVQRGL